MNLTEITDRLLITETLHRYSDRVDRADIDGVLDLFTDDADLDMGSGTVVSGRDELHPLVSRLVGRWTHTSHHCSTTSLTAYDGASAATTTLVYVFHDRPADGVTMELWGRYEDTLIRHEESWLIRRRRLRVAGVRHGSSSELPERFERFARNVSGTTLPLPNAVW